MRFLMTALALVGGLAVGGCDGCGCKDKGPAKQKPTPESRSPVVTPPRPLALGTTEITGPGLVPAVGLGPKLTVNSDEITLDGQGVLTIERDGPLDRERLDKLMRLLEQKVTGDAPLAITLDASVPYRRVGQLLDVLKRAGFRNLALVVGSGNSMIPLELLEPAEAATGVVRPVVTINRTRLTLWSVTGAEGTKQAPRMSLALGSPPALEPLTHALAEIVQRRWPDGKRGAADLAIIVELDGNSSADTMLRTLAAIRSDGPRTLFPNIYLSGGR